MSRNVPQMKDLNPIFDEDDLLPRETIIQRSYDINITENFQETGITTINMWCLDRSKSIYKQLVLKEDSSHFLEIKMRSR